MNLIVRIFKAFGAPDVSEQWVNNYEISDYEGSIDAFDLQLGLVNTFVTAEKQIHLTSVHFIKATVSTYQPDSKPYDPSVFASIPLAGTGLRSSTTQALDRNVAYFIRKTPRNGRNGKIFYRGVLAEGDVNSSSSLRFRLEANSPLAAGGEDFAAYQLVLDPYVGSAGDGDPRLAMIHTDGALAGIARPVIDLTPGGVVINRHNHKYFDRA